ncbi:purine-cytosine permease family protein [Gluconacetobacter tumulisoli]|uniref:Cytosine permease n=1 Tax=Gluconacetobacter tumulisoli TaxID=1286189 RepID=A0A7W4K8I3_9PROT|nr:cytosine permease [Gluconacetobacter tumulisoli]MBB2202333.1 cytosine permease [Gluconacetobacter tumulisoli]
MGTSTYIEQETIYPIPADRRHGTAYSLFTLWFGANVKILTIVTGALATTAFHLRFLDAAIALVVGNVAGAVFMAAHAAQGPRLGVPQMVQTRGQFGSLGSILVTLIVILMYAGYTASNVTIGGRSIHSEFTAIPAPLAILGVGSLSLAVAISGYDVIHRCARYLSIVAAVTLALCFAWILGVRGLPADFLARGQFSIHDFVGAISVAALWQLSYAPYVSDYSRYLPQDTGAAPAFWGTYAGVVLGSTFPMLLGAMVGVVAEGGDVVGTLAHSLGGLSGLAITVFSITVACCGALDMYGGMLAVITVVQGFRSDWRPGPVARMGFCALIFACGAGMALNAQADFLENYMNFLFLLLYVLVPWTAINLVDYYLVHHGDYDVTSFFRADGGIYGRWNGRALLCYAVGIVVQVPFMSSALYTGPAARELGGADLSWIVGLIVVSPLYYLACRLRRAEPLPGGRVADAV